jgi:hypothetical protein
VIAPVTASLRVNVRILAPLLAAALTIVGVTAITVKSIDLNNAAVTGNDTKQNWNTTVGQVVTNFIVDAVTPTIVSAAASKGFDLINRCCVFSIGQRYCIVFQYISS